MSQHELLFESGREGPLDLITCGKSPLKGDRKVPIWIGKGKMPQILEWKGKGTLFVKKKRTAFDTRREKPRVIWGGIGPV